MIFSIFFTNNLQRINWWVKIPYYSQYSVYFFLDIIVEVRQANIRSMYGSHIAQINTNSIAAYRAHQL